MKEMDKKQYPRVQGRSCINLFIKTKEKWANNKNKNNNL